MQRATTPDPAPTPAMASTPTGCPVCGEPVRGITTERPGEHRFVGCEHYASARFLRHRADAAGAPRLSLGP